MWGIDNRVRQAHIVVDQNIGEHVPYDWFRCWPAHWSRSVRVDDNILKNVVFIGIPSKDPASFPEWVSEEQLAEIDASIHWGGTGFLVTIDHPPGNPIIFNYVVTAKHVADAIEGKPAILRMNFQGSGGPAHFNVPPNAKWWRHPETPDSVDVAVMPWMPPHEIADFSLMQAHEWLLTDEIAEKHNIGPGDNVYAVGLFTLAKGRDRNVPIVRTGHIAIMSKEKIPGIRIGHWRGEAEVYVVEARSIGGLSGSPVFVRGTQKVPFRPQGESENVMLYGVGSHYLLGLVHGHWVIPSDTINEVQIRPTGERSEANLGLAIVVPAPKIMEVLNHPELIEIRERETIKKLGTNESVQDTSP
jgi:hypothetical protein